MWKPACGDEVPGASKPGVSSAGAGVRVWSVTRTVLETHSVRVEVERQPAHPLQRRVRLTRKQDQAFTQYQVRAWSGFETCELAYIFIICLNLALHKPLTTSFRTGLPFQERTSGTVQ